MSAFRGSGSTDTGRFENKTIKMMNKIKFPPELTSKKINMEKVELEPFKKWIALKTETILGIEDDILTNLIFNLLQKEQFPNARYIYVQLVPFLERHVRKFMIELWELLDSAQESGTGIPQEMLNSLRAELSSKKKEQSKIGDALEKRYGDNSGTKREHPDRNYERVQNIDHRDRDRYGRDRDRDRHRDRDRERSRGYSERDRRTRRRDRSRDWDRDRRERSRYDERSSRSKRQPRSPQPPNIVVKKEKKRKRRPVQMASPSPPACLQKEPSVKKEKERSSSSDSSSSEDSSSSSDS